MKKITIILLVVSNHLLAQTNRIRLMEDVYGQHVPTSIKQLEKTTSSCGCTLSDVTRAAFGDTTGIPIYVTDGLGDETMIDLGQIINREAGVMISALYKFGGTPYLALKDPASPYTVHMYAGLLTSNKFFYLPDDPTGEIMTHETDDPVTIGTGGSQFTYYTNNLMGVYYGGNIVGGFNHVGSVGLMLLANGSGNAVIKANSSGSFGYGLPDNSGTILAPFHGTGNPNTVVTADIGKIYINDAGGVNITLWVKESGMGTNTGWVNK